MDYESLIQLNYSDGEELGEYLRKLAFTLGFQIYRSIPKMPLEFDFFALIINLTRVSSEPRKQGVTFN